jgi:hypothetical protein
MRRRKLLLAVAGLALFVGGVLSPMPNVPIPLGVTRENFERIKVGMSLTDIERLLGKQPDGFDDPSKYSLDPRPGAKLAYWEADDEHGGDELNGAGGSETWESDEARVCASFDASGHAVGEDFERADRPDDFFADIF